MLGSVSSQQRFGVTDIKTPGASQLSGLGQTVLQLLDKSLLQLYFIQKIARESSRCEGMPTQRHEEKRVGKHASAQERERERAPFGPSFYVFFPPPGSALCKLGQPGVLFVLPEVLTPVFGPYFVLFSWAFPFLVFQPPPFWTPFPYSNSLTFPTQRDEGPNSSGIRASRSLWLLPADLGLEGHWASPLASLKPQSPYSSVHLRVSDIFCGQLQFYISLLN